MYSRKINFNDEGIINNDYNDNRNSISSSPTHSLSKKISAAAIRNSRHTVTHVTQISPENLSDEGLDFILSHVSDPIWPRTICTNATSGRQVIINNKEEALAYFKAANYIDCRISAYPYWRPSKVFDFVGIKNTTAPYLIMIDLDLSNFNGEFNTINHTLRKTFQRIDHLLGLTPTVIWSGNGYHIYVPISAVVLEDFRVRKYRTSLNQVPKVCRMVFVIWKI